MRVEDSYVASVRNLERIFFSSLLSPAHLRACLFHSTDFVEIVQHVLNMIGNRIFQKGDKFFNYVWCFITTEMAVLSYTQRGMKGKACDLTMIMHGEITDRTCLRWQISFLFSAPTDFENVSFLLFLSPVFRSQPTFVFTESNGGE